MDQLKKDRDYITTLRNNILQKHIIISTPTQSPNLEQSIIRKHMHKKIPEIDSLLRSNHEAIEIHTIVEDLIQRLIHEQVLINVA